MINFILPGFFEHYNIHVKLLYYKYKNPEWFYPNVNIYALYGTFPFWIWDGGRVFKKYRQATQQNVKTILKTFSQVSLELICTIPELKEENLYNHFCNLCLEMCENPNNGIIINNPMLESYIRKTYPKYHFISSTTKCLTKKDVKQELNNEDYKLICLDYNLNNNWNFLDSLSIDEINKCELLCNEMCPPKCPDRLKHYKKNGEFSLSIGKPQERICHNHFLNNVCPDVRNAIHHISPQQIFDEYEPRGFQYFKLEGRTLNDLENILNYSYYLIKPEYKDNFLWHMLYKECNNEINEQEII